jgi:hypothetical protein
MSVGCLPTMRNLFMTRAQIKKHLFLKKSAYNKNNKQKSTKKRQKSTKKKQKSMKKNM